MLPLQTKFYRKMAKKFNAYFKHCLKILQRRDGHPHLIVPGNMMSGLFTTNIAHLFFLRCLLLLLVFLVVILFLFCCEVVLYSHCYYILKTCLNIISLLLLFNKKFIVLMAMLAFLQQLTSQIRVPVGPVSVVSFAFLPFGHVLFRI